MSKHDKRPRVKGHESKALHLLLRHKRKEGREGVIILWALFYDPVFHPVSLCNKPSRCVVRSCPLTSWIASHKLCCVVCSNARPNQKGNTMKGNKTQSMTSQEAKTFEHGLSQKNYLIVKMLLASKSHACECEPYQDVFTYKRWVAQGFHVVRGSKAIKAPLVKTGSKEVKNKATGKVDKSFWRVLTVSYLFCRCQVQKS